MAVDIAERRGRSAFTRDDGVRRIGARVSWGAIFSGLFATLGIWAVLSAFGSALGFTIFRMGEGVAREGAGTFSTLWAVLTPLVAFFVGGLVAGRLCGAITQVSGMLHGLVLWSLTGLAAVALGGAFLDVNNLILTLQGDPSATGFMLWGLFAGMVLSLMAAMIGAALGISKADPQQARTREVLPLVERREVVHRDVVGSTPGPAATRAAHTEHDSRADFDDSRAGFRERADLRRDVGYDEDGRDRERARFSGDARPATHDSRAEFRSPRADSREGGFRERLRERADLERDDARDAERPRSSAAARSAGAGAAVLAGAGVASSRARAAGSHPRGVAGRIGLEGRHEEVPRERWSDLLEALTEFHRDDPVRVEVAGETERRRPLVVRSPLVGLDFQAREPERGIDILVGDGAQVYDHRIEEPQHLYFHEDTERGTSDLAIEDAAHKRTLIHFSPGPSRRDLN